jgi:hypothetical protein
LAGFRFGQRSLNDGAFAVHFGGVVGTLGVGGQVGQLVLGFGNLLTLVCRLFALQAQLARFKTGAGRLGLIG